MRQLHFDLPRLLENDRQGSHGSRRARRYVLAQEADGGVRVPGRDEKSRTMAGGALTSAPARVGNLGGQPVEKLAEAVQAPRRLAELRAADPRRCDETNEKARFTDLNEYPASAAR